MQNKNLTVNESKPELTGWEFPLMMLQGKKKNKEKEGGGGSSRQRKDERKNKGETKEKGQSPLYFSGVSQPFSRR